MMLKCSDREQIYHIKHMIRAVAKFGLLDRSRFEEQYKIVEIMHFTSFFNVEVKVVAHVDVPPI
jgi:hypothetical protein